MADLLQKVFMILARPYYTNFEGNKIFHSGTIYAQYTPPTGGGTESHVPLSTNNSSGSAISPTKLNEETKFTKDPWFLHSTYTSYNRFRDELKNVIALYGTDNVKCAIYVPIDFEVLPNQ